jgi:uncharacterized protein (UPF0332 family)
MSFNWIDLFDVAVDLLKGNNEAYFRSSINRTYYAMFGRTRQILETEEKKIFQPPNVHKQVIDFLKKNNDNLYKQIGYDLNRLRRERVKVDYRDDITIKRDTALKVHTWAEKLKTDLAAI